MNRFYVFLSFLLIGPLSLSAQTSISGIVNQYTEVLSITEDCLTRIQVNDTTGFHRGQMALLIQMQGAEIATSNNNNFGQVMDLGGAGHFELVRIDSLAEQMIFFRNALLHLYTPPTGSVQLVTIPQFDHAVVTDTLKPQPWDGSTGGVLIVQADNRLELQAPIDASATGFRGGIARSNLPNDCSWLNISSRQYYDSNSWRGAIKGEGIATYISGREAGRGPQGNGGGGGNDHNSGGGGGGHVHPGGDGGENNEPSTFGCRGRNPGRGGNSLPNQSDRLWMGGGGGAGHGNNDNASDGGHGGGIILLLANTIEANGQTIAANGASVTGTIGDGGGGGGAAGTIAFFSNTLEGMPRVALNGGQGGSVDNNNENRCFGPGGGGSPGTLMLASTLVQSDVMLSATAGAAGTSFNSRSCSDGTNGAEASSDQATIVQDQELPLSSTSLAPQFLATVDTLEVCQGDTIEWSLPLSGIPENFQWQWDQGGTWVDIPSDGNHLSNDNQLFLQNVPAQFNNRRYRLWVQDSCGQSILSSPTLIQVLPLPNAGFSTSVSDATVQFNNSSTQANQFSWSFGDGNSSNETNPQHTYTNDGTYVVQLIAENVCGTDTFSQSITITLPIPPTALFTGTPLQGCAPLRVQFSDQSGPNITSRTWEFPGGTPSSSSDPNPIIQYNTPGLYAVQLTVRNAAGSDQSSSGAFIEVFGPPNASFGLTTTGRTITCANQSSAANSFRWNFGDGQTSTLASPTHTYTSGGQYTIQLIAENPCGTDTATQTINLPSIAAPTAQFSSSATRGCTPFTVSFNDLSEPDIQSRVWTFPGGNPASSTDANPVVTYDVPGTYPVKLEVQNVIGTDSREALAYLEVTASPRAAFDIDVRGDSIFLTNLSTDAARYRWNLGDGTTSTERNPVHVYANNGIYRITLIAENQGCGSVISREVSILTTSTEQSEAEKGFRLYPNPATTSLWIDWPVSGSKQKIIRIYSISGQLKEIIDVGQANNWEIPVDHLVKGVYWFEIQMGKDRWWKKVIIL